MYTHEQVFVVASGSFHTHRQKALTMPTAPTNYRPESVDDLLDSTHDGDLAYTVLSVHDLGRIARVPGALAALGTLLDVLRNDAGDGERPAVMVDDSNGVGVISARQPFTDDEGARQVASSQERYDRGRKLYQQYLDLMHDEVGVDHNRLDEFARKHRYAWAYYLKRERIPAPLAEDK
ncbi:hypothetical protein J1771_gp46 [Gordonia phage MelBins]|uniref:Uncharacterized protein n=1 Tax=Gordonia phage MelBins TaxID=2656540 RepID=A0A649VME4_9CAUD|nr:hypothetical protein J1771_gp46 [Gordonia phage MelBins]QGJ93600.1 hypothetical protein SEA_MELBINS_46 [Gordonia phage MelBins]